MKADNENKKPRQKSLKSKLSKKMFKDRLKAIGSSMKLLSEYTGIAYSTMKNWDANDDIPLHLERFLEVLELLSDINCKLKNETSIKRTMIEDIQKLKVIK